MLVGWQKVGQGVDIGEEIVDLDWVVWMLGENVVEVGVFEQWYGVYGWWVCVLLCWCIVVWQFWMVLVMVEWLVGGSIWWWYRCLVMNIRLISGRVSRLVKIDQVVIWLRLKSMVEMSVVIRKNSVQVMVICWLQCVCVVEMMFECVISVN